MSNSSKLLNYVNGHFVGSAADNYIENIDPADGSVISLIPNSTSDDVNVAVAAAHAALSNPNWHFSRVTARQRSEWLHKIADGIQSRFEEFARAESLDTGKYLYKFVAWVSRLY